MKKYRLKDEKFRKPAEAIAGIIEEMGLSLEHFVSREGSGIRERLKEYGVFDLWFEEVPKYKAGDYIVAVGAGQRDKARKIANCKVADDRLIWSEYGDIGEGFAHAWELSKIRHATAEEIKEYNRPKYKAGDYISVLHSREVYEIEECKVIGDILHWNTVGVDRMGYEYRFSTPLDNIRIPTAEEIEEYKKQLPTINGYRGKRIFDYIVYGCKSIHVQDFIRLYETCTDLEVSSITIEGQEVPMETLNEIYEKTY